MPLYIWCRPILLKYMMHDQQCTFHITLEDVVFWIHFLNGVGYDETKEFEQKDKY